MTNAAAASLAWVQHIRRLAGAQPSESEPGPRAAAGSARGGDDDKPPGAQEDDH